MNTVLVVDGIVRLVWIGGLPTSTVPPIEGTLVETKEDVVAGMLYDGKKFENPPIEKEVLLSYVDTLRWRRETGGIVFKGVDISTTDRSRGLIREAYDSAKEDPKFTTIWNGVVEFNAKDLTDLYSAVRKHVADCFALAAKVKAQIEDGKVTKKEQIDKAFRNCL